MKNFKPYSKGFEEMLQLPGVRAAVEDRAKQVEETARANAPVGPTGAYQESIHTEQLSSRDGGWTEIFDRPISRVVADVGHAAVVESRHRTLGSAADAAGGS